MAKLMEKVQSSAADQADDGTSWLRNALRFDRYGDAISGTGGMLVNKLPGRDDKSDSLVGTAQRAVDRARGTVSSAFDQMQMPDSLSNISIPGRKQKKRGSSKLIMIGAIAALAAGGYFVYRWLNGGGQSMDYGIQESWPAEPSPGTVNEKPEDDATVSRDAEESVNVLDGGSPGASVTP